MNCIVLCGREECTQKKEGKTLKASELWEGDRSVEILGYHNKNKLINIQILLYIKNKLPDGKKNYLYMLHAGNVSAELISPWPLPFHTDVKNAINQNDLPEQPKSILESLYGMGFQKYQRRLCEVYGLSSWDTWYPQQKKPVTIWPKEENQLSGDKLSTGIQRMFSDECNNHFVPLSIFKLGPFTKTGPVLIALNIVISGETYSKLLGGQKIFTVDGPDTLMLRIKHEFIPEFTDDKDEQQKWRKRLAYFKNYVGFGESYDVITLQPPVADKVKYINSSGIIEASKQPPGHLGQRFITRCQGFTLCLKLAPTAKPEHKTQKVLIKT